MEGTRFTVRTDHDSLKWILNLTDSTSQLARCCVCLSEYDFNVVHLAGKKHEGADALSRLRTTVEDQMHLDDDLPVPAIDEQENGEQTIHVINTDKKEKIPLRASEEQPLDAPLTERELLLEQKLD